MADMTFPTVEPQTEAEYKAIIEQLSREMDVMLRQMEVRRAETLRIRAQSNEISRRADSVRADIEARVNRLWGKR